MELLVQNRLYGYNGGERSHFFLFPSLASSPAIFGLTWSPRRPASLKFQIKTLPPTRMADACMEKRKKQELKSHQISPFNSSPRPFL